MTNPSMNPDTRLSDERLEEMLAAWEAQSNHARLGHGMNMHELEIISALTELQALRAPAETEPVAWRYRSSYDGTWQFWPADAWNEPRASPYLEAHPDADPLYIRNPSQSDREVSEAEAFLALIREEADKDNSPLGRSDSMALRNIRTVLQSSMRGQP